MTAQCDVAIIGAGPAGSTLAALLATRGFSVTLVERDVFPRDKLCGEFLSYDALPVLDALGVLSLIDARGVSRITSCTVASARGQLNFDFPAPARGISRLLLDAILFRRAVALGAIPLEGWTANRIDRDAARFTVELEKNGETQRIDANVVVGAWGRWGRMDLQLGRAFTRDRTSRHFGFKRHYIPIRERAAARIELHPFDRGYLGVSSVEAGVTNICGLVRADRLSGHRGRWERFVDDLKRESPQLRSLFDSHEPAQSGFLSSDPVILTAKSPVEQGVLLIGDSAGLIDPLAGNGMAMGIQSALLVAPIVAAIIESSEHRDHAERRWAATWYESFSSRIAWSRRLAFLLSRPWLLASAISLLPGRSIGTTLLRKTRADVAEIDARVRRWLLPARAS